MHKNIARLLQSRSSCLTLFQSNVKYNKAVHSQLNQQQTKSAQSIALLSARCVSTTPTQPLNFTDSSILDETAFATQSLKVTRLKSKEWKKILSNAEKIVGYPTSFLNLRYLVSDEVAHFASLLRKLMLTKHPLITTAQRLLTEPDRYTQMNGLIVLLVAKASGLPSKSSFLSTEITDGIHQSQRCLAEITEMINMASIIHNGVLDVKMYKANQHKDMDYGNKLAILCGDYLLANACTHLAKLRNATVVDIMSQVIADISQSIFIRSIGENVSKTLIDRWYDKLYNSSSSLLANGCKASLILVNHSLDGIQENIWNFAKNLDIVHKLWSELSEYKRDGILLKNETLLNAIYMDKYLDIKEEKHSQQRLNEIEYSLDENIRKSVLNDSIFIFNKHYDLAINYLGLAENPNSQPDAIASLKAILSLMRNNLDDI